MQLDLGFLKILRPAPSVWETLEDEQRVAVLDVLERLIVQAAQRTPETEDDDDE